MKKYVFIVSISICCVLLISFANTQSVEGVRFKIASSDFIFTLSHTHAQVKLDSTFLRHWRAITPSTDSPKSLTFEYITVRNSESLLKVHDFIQTDQEQVKSEVEKRFESSDLKLVNDREMILNDHVIDFMFFQDTKQNVCAYFIFKIEGDVFAVEIITNFELYSELYNHTYEIFNSIEPARTKKNGFDKIMINTSATILVPNYFQYTLPINTDLFYAKSDELTMQCLSYETSKSTRKVANDVEQKLAQSLGFKRTAGEITILDENEKVLLTGSTDKGKNLRVYVVKKDAYCIAFVFTFENFAEVEQTINQIVDSIEIRTDFSVPDYFLPFAYVYDTNSDENPDYFIINMIFFTKNHNVISERFRKGILTVRITDENQKTVYVSEPIDVNAPRDCLSGGVCSEKLRFDGLWVSKLMSEEYSLTIYISFGQSKITYKGNLTDLIIR